MSLVLLCAAYIAEPIIWLYSMYLRFKKRYASAFPYFAYLFLDTSITGLKNLEVIRDAVGQTFFTFASFLLALMFVNVLFIGNGQDKLLHIGEIFLISLSGDVLSVGSLCAIGYSINELSVPGMLNSVATALSKSIEFLLVKTVFTRKENRKSEYEIPIILATLIMEIPSAIIFRKIGLINNNDSLLILFALGQIGLLIIVVYFMRALDVRNRKEEELLKWQRDMEMQLKGSEGAEHTLENLRELRHDMKQHFGVLKVMLDDGKYEEAKEFLAKLYRSIDVAGDYFALSNRSVSITLTLLKQYAKERNIEFHMKIMTTQFYLDDLEICAIISNIGRNAVEAAELTEERYCKMFISEENEGCRIYCKNTYKEPLKLYKGQYCSTKGEGHGYGINIVRRIVKQHNGKASFKDSKGVFTVEIFVPKGGY